MTELSIVFKSLHNSLYTNKEIAKTRLPTAFSTLVIIAVLTFMPMKALAQTTQSDVAQAKLNVELSNMDIISGYDMSRPLLGDHPTDPGAESVLLKCDQNIQSVKQNCDTHPEWALKTCLD
ncbi:MAG: hypothetical protein DLM72_05785, partial [Candidatus Nitrosopolaris wilkensis]